MSWYMVMLCGAVGGVFLGFVFGAVLGLWVMGEGAPEDCPARRSPSAAKAPEGKQEDQQGDAAGEVGPVGPVGQVPAPSGAGEEPEDTFARKPHITVSLDMLWGWVCANCHDYDGERGCNRHCSRIEDPLKTTCDYFNWWDRRNQCGRDQ